MLCIDVRHINPQHITYHKSTLYFQNKHSIDGYLNQFLDLISKASYFVVKFLRCIIILITAGRHHMAFILCVELSVSSVLSSL